MRVPGRGIPPEGVCAFTRSRISAWTSRKPCLEAGEGQPASGHPARGAAPPVQRTCGKSPDPQRCSRGLRTCGGAALPSLGDKCHAGTHAASPPSLREREQRGGCSIPRRRRRRWQAGPGSAAIGARLCRAGTLPGRRAAGRQHTTAAGKKTCSVTETGATSAEAAAGSASSLAPRPTESLQLPRASRSGKSPRQQSTRSGLGR